VAEPNDLFGVVYAEGRKQRTASADGGSASFLVEENVRASAVDQAQMQPESIGERRRERDDSCCMR
jgi:hypothetical protein